MNIDLQGKQALVCGSTQGIGKAVAMELAGLGAAVTLVARNEEDLKSTVAGLPGKAKHDYIVADFSRPEELRQKMEKYSADKRCVHILVNNTGGPQGGPVTDAKTEEFLQAFSNHLICNHILVQSVLAGMKAAAYGRIINIISTSVKQPIRGLGVSNTIRAAVASWAKTLSVEVAPFGITVNNILPGATNTARLHSIVEAKAAKTGKTVKKIEEEMLEEIPLGRFAEASEIAAAVAFLASPAASYITGINVPVDGGRTASL